MFAVVVYLLCALTSSVCALMLLHKFRRVGNRLLLCMGVGFIGLALNNVMLFIDLIVVPEFDLAIWRLIPALLGLMTMIFGLVRERV